MPILARMLNAGYLIQTPHDMRIFFCCLFQFLAFILLLAAIVFPNESVGIPCASLAALLFGATKAVGEATIVGYIKSIPQELICTFGTGTGIGDAFQAIFTIAITKFGIGAIDYSMFFAFLLVPYFLFFKYFETARLKHK